MAEQEVLQLADSQTDFSLCSHRLSDLLSLCIPWRVRVDPISSTSTSGGGADGGTQHVVFPCSSVPSGGGGALFVTHSGTALNGALCGVSLFLTTSGTALTGGPHMLILVLFHCSHSNVPFTEKERCCHAQQLRNRSRNGKDVTRGISRRSGVENTDRNTLSHLTVTHTNLPPPEAKPLPNLSSRRFPEISTETETRSFTVNLDPFPSSLNLPFSTLRIFFLKLSCSCPPPLRLYLRCRPLSQQLRKFSSCMASYSLIKSPSS